MSSPESEALQTVVEELTRAGVPVPGTGRVFPAAVGEMANAAAGRILSQALAIQALSRGASVDPADVEKTAAWIDNTIAQTGELAPRMLAEMLETLAARLRRAEARDDVFGPLREVVEAIAPTGGREVEGDGQADDVRTAAPALARWASERIGHLTEKGEAIAGEIERLKTTILKAAPPSVDVEAFEHADALGVLEVAGSLVELAKMGAELARSAGENAREAADQAATLRRVLRAVAPQIVGYEHRAVPGLVVEHVERVLRERDGLRAALAEHLDRVAELLAQREEARAAIAGDVIVLPLEHARTLREEAFHDLKASDLGADDLRAAAALATAIEEAEGR